MLMHTLFEFSFLHVQVHLFNAVMLMKMKEDQKSFKKIFEKL